MTSTFTEVGRLYDACRRSYEVFGEGTGHRHMPLYAPGCESRADCLEETSRVISDTLVLAPGDSVIDLGCGVGSGAVAIAKQYGCSVIGLAATHYEVRAASERARQAGVSERCRFVVHDMNDMPGLGEIDVAAIINLETDCYLAPLAHRVADIGCLLKRGGYWHTLRFEVTDEGRQCKRGRKWIRFVERAWRTAALTTSSEIMEATKPSFCLEQQIDLGDRVVAFWDHFVPVELGDEWRVLSRFAAGAVSERRNWWSVKQVFEHRLAFWKVIYGIAAGWMSYTYYRFRRV